MKTHFTILSIFLFALSTVDVIAQDRPTRTPPPSRDGRPAPVTRERPDPDAVRAAQPSAQREAHRMPTTEFEVNDMKVIFKLSSKNTVSVRLFVPGGTANYDASKAGVESMAFQLAADGGPEEFKRQDYKSSLEAIGARVSGESGYDYGVISLTCLKDGWDSAWELFSKTVAKPAMRESEFDVLKQQMMAASMQIRSNPDSYLEQLAVESTFDGTSYTTKPGGDRESLTKLTLNDVKAHYGKVLNRKGCFLVVVGNITRADLEEKVAGAFAKLPQGTPSTPVYTAKRVTEGVKKEARAMETNYILAFSTAPKKYSRDAVYNALAMSMLYDRLFEEIRTKRSLSYAPTASVARYHRYPVNRFYVSTTNPKEAIKVMVDEISKAREKGFTEEELNGKKQGFLTQYFMGQQTTASMSMQLGLHQLSGSWRTADGFASLVEAARLSDVNNQANIQNSILNYTYLGNLDLITDRDFLQPLTRKTPEKGSSHDLQVSPLRQQQKATPERQKVSPPDR